MTVAEAAAAVLARMSAAALAGAGDRRALLVITYHRVLEVPDPLLPGEPDAKEFARQLEALGRAFNLLPLPEAAERLERGTLPRRAACLTFDDGYANNCEVALPLLLRRGVPATVFVATGFLDGGRMFNDTVIEAVRRARGALDLTSLGLSRFQLSDDVSRLRAIDQILPAIKHLEPAIRARRAEQVAQLAEADLPTDLMMSTAQVRKLADAGVDVGGHTVTHPILAKVSSDSAREEITLGRRTLEAITGRPVVSFAYPNGRPDEDYRAEHASMVQEAGFRVAVSTARGVAQRGCDLLQLPRVPIWGRAVPDKVLRLAAAYRERSYPCAVKAKDDARAATGRASPGPR